MRKKVRREDKKVYVMILCLFIFSFVQLGMFTVSVSAESFIERGAEIERNDGGYYTIADEKGNVLLQTAHTISVGDEYIASDNSRYRIVEVKGDVGRAKLIGKEDGFKPAEFLKIFALQNLLGLKGKGRKAIAIYHTHSDESYIPTDGAASIYANGGIFKVGNSFSSRLSELGFEVIHSKRPHDPHDANAYMRSRRTAVQLLQQNPMALVDVHRDAAPPNVYSTKIQGKPITRVKIVIGRSNPRFNANLQFAKQLKAELDRTQPGVVQGILLTKGNFNQDLSPRAILVEVGAHTNSRYAAQRGIALFADALPKVLGVTGVSPKVPVARSNRGDWTALFWGIVLLGGVIAGYLLINAGGWRGAWEQLRGFFQGEFLDISRKTRK
ncbi:MAG: stage II sporulation protein P [Thermacetogeniaceae bacterium]